MKPFKVIKSKSGWVIIDPRGRVFQEGCPYKTKKEAQDQANEWSGALIAKISESYAKMEKEN